MSIEKDPFEVVIVEETLDDFSALSRKSIVSNEPAAALPGVATAATAKFHGFGLGDEPLLSHVPGVPGEIVIAKTVVQLIRAQIGATVVVLFEEGDARRPIVIGVVQERPGAASATATAPQLVSVRADEDRIVLSAEREIVLQCGDASITLTRAGKVLIKGAYILSRSSGYNKIKGAAVDIN